MTSTPSTTAREMIASLLQESHISMSDSDIPALAYRQPAELIYRPEIGKIDAKILGVLTYGLPSDSQPAKHGVQEIQAVVKMLEKAEIPCCMAAEPALGYYGTTRIMKDWFICVPTELYEKAVDLARANTVFEPFTMSHVDLRSRLRNIFPRFKFVGLSLIFRILPGKMYLLDIRPDNIERSQTGIPYPKLAAFAQGLLDTLDTSDLTDLVDGMNLSMEWGEENLDMEGTVSVEWAIWKSYTIFGGEVTPGNVPMYVLNPPKRREVWSRIQDPEMKKRRMGFKYPQEFYETRFRRRGQGDPRSSRRDWC